MKKFVSMCTLLAIVAVAAFASTAKESLKGPEATKQVIRKLDQSKVKALPVENYTDERETMKLELEALNATISSMIEKGDDISAHKARANELYGILFPARGASSLDQGGDACADAVAIGGLPYCDEGTTVGFADNYTPSCVFGASPDVVYSYTPTATEVVTVSLLGSNYDTGLHIWDGCPDAGATEVACNDDNVGLASCVIDVTLAGGVTYYIVVDGFNGAAGNYLLHVSTDGVCGRDVCPATCEDPGPIADNCQDAVLAAVPSVQYGSTVGTTADILGFCGTSDGSNGGVWYKVIGTGNTMTATTCDPCSDFDTKIRVFTCGCDIHSCVAGNDDSGCPLGGLLSSVSWATDLGAEYLILVHGFSGSAGRFGLTLSDDGVPSNGDGIDCPCHDEQLAAPGSTSGTTFGAGNDCALRSTEDWVVEVSIPYADEWRFSLCGSSYDTYLFLGTDCCLGDIASNDDFCSLGSEICTFVPEGLIYVTIEGFNGSGDWTLLVEPCVPPVGSCCYSEAGGNICSVPLCADNLTEGECAQLGGVWTRDGNCVDNACPGAAPCVCRCGELPNSHGTFAIDNTTYPVISFNPATCLTVNVPVEYNITDLNVSLDFIHTFDGDVDIYVTSPMGTTVILSNNRGGAGDNFLCTTFDDEAGTPVGAGAAPFSGSWIPDEALSAFDGENAVGDWYVCFDDQVGGDDGFVLGVCLAFEYDRILPVAFGSFDAVSGDAQVTLNWNTSSESNVANFEVLRDGAKVGEVAAQNSATGASYSYVDNGLTNGMTYSYTLVSVDLNGDRATLATQSATPVGSAVISAYALHQNYPNPFNPTTNIAFDMVEAGNVSISIFNVMGQKIAEIVSGNMNAGRHVVSFDATGLSSGLYLYKMEANGFTAQAKMVLMK